MLPSGIPILSVEAYSTLGWEKYSHEQFGKFIYSIRICLTNAGINTFGSSGPYKDVYKKFEMTPEGIAKRAKATVDFWKDVKPIRSPLDRAFENKLGDAPTYT